MNILGITGRWRKIDDEGGLHIRKGMYPETKVFQKVLGEPRAKWYIIGAVLCFYNDFKLYS